MTHEADLHRKVCDMVVFRLSLSFFPNAITFASIVEDISWRAPVGWRGGHTLRKGVVGQQEMELNRMEC